MVLTDSIREIEDIFEISECSHGQKVKYAIYMLKGEALHCWHIVKVACGNKPIRMMPWEQFTQLLMEKFRP